MLYQQIEKEILEKKQRNEILLPDYEKYSITKVLPTAASLLAIKIAKPLPKDLWKDYKGQDKVLVFLADGLRYDLIKSYLSSKNPISSIVKSSVFFPLTSVFPTATPSALTSLATTLPPNQHGLLEIMFFSKRLEYYVDAFSFSLVGNAPNSLYLLGLDESFLFDGITIFKKLSKKVKTYCFVPSKLFTTAFTRASFESANLMHFESYVDLFSKLKQLLEMNEKMFVYVYFDDIDIVQHKHGIDSEEELQEVSTFFYFFKKFLERLKEKPAIIITSDHGQAQISKRIYLDNFVFLSKFLQKTQEGFKILPYGSSKELFFQIKENKLEKVKATLEKKLKGRAWVFTLKEANELGLFGFGKNSEKFFDRVGNLIVVAKNNYELVYRDAFHYFLRFHGSLTKEEVLVPFILVKQS